MKNRYLKYIFSLMLFSVLLMVGCGSGGGQSVLQQESPEDAVMRISNTWRASTDKSPKIEVDADGKFVRQVNESDSDSQESYISYFTLTDFAGKKFIIYVMPNGIEKQVDIALVHTHFIYDKGYLEIVFKLIFDEDQWWLDDCNIKDVDGSLPTIIVPSNFPQPEGGSGGDDPDPEPEPEPKPEPEPEPEPVPVPQAEYISGYIYDSNGNAIKSGVTLTLYSADDTKNPIEPAPTVSNEGFYKFKKPEKAGIYLLVVSANGFETQTISIKVGDGN